MKRFFAMSSLALFSILALSGCNDYGNTFQNNTGAQVFIPRSDKCFGQYELVHHPRTLPQIWACTGNRRP